MCEGYSKAFKYLCDLTSFNSSRIQCYLVTGTMTGGTGAGEHMWDIVTMDDGKNYVVDVTNCDGDSDKKTIGYPDKLFLKGYKSGSVSTSYAFSCGVTYKYDSDTLAHYTTAELTISAADYDINSAPPAGPGPIEAVRILQYSTGLLTAADFGGQYGSKPADAAAFLKQLG